MKCPAGLIALCALLLSSQVRAAEDDPPPDPAIELRLAAAKGRLGVDSVQSRCRNQRQGDEIVVCVDRGEDQRVPSTADSDPNSLAARHALNNGIPRAPQLDRGSCKGEANCIGFGWVPPPVYVVDVAALPKAPEGSEADRIAKGEIPEP